MSEKEKRITFKQVVDVLMRDFDEKSFWFLDSEEQEQMLNTAIESIVALVNGDDDEAKWWKEVA